MDRRKFIRSGSLALMAAAALPKAAKAFRQEPAATLYRTAADKEKEGQWIYEISINHYGFENFKTASAEEKMLILKVAYFATTDFEKPTKQGEYQYAITGATAAQTQNRFGQSQPNSEKKFPAITSLIKVFRKTPKSAL